MWNDLIAAIALFLVFEGIMPFMNPNKWRTVVRLVSDQNDRALRIMGLGSMLVGVCVLYLNR